MEDLSNLYEKYKTELEDDLDIDDFTLHDKQMKLPGIKHKWVARLIQMKQMRHKLDELRDAAIKKVVEQLREEAIVTLTERSLITKAVDNELVRKIETQTRDCKILIDYLERVEKVLSQTTFDIKNLIEIKKLEIT